jgi:hypothetical protein
MVVAQPMEVIGVVGAIAWVRAAGHPSRLRRTSLQPANLARWSGGRWSQTCWGGRCGWWWATGGLWYFYAAPVYPYPLEVSPITYAAPIYDPAYSPDMTGLAPQSNFSYCDNPQGYYPTVPQCNTPWHEYRTPAGSQ